MSNATPQGANMLQAILRRPAVTAYSGYSNSTIYLRISQGLWTTSVRIGKRAVGWPEGDVVALNAARIAGKSDDEIRTLVCKLHAARGVGDLPALKE